jgi:hypothetical protein
MRTKTLLIAAAALAATVISSEAQVYSGIVGYVNETFPAGTFILASNPLDDGTNTCTSVGANLPNKSVIDVWNSDGSGFTSCNKAGGVWTPDLPLPPGTGFFVVAKTAITNTFVGSVDTLPGGYTTNSLPAGLFILSGSTIPFSGDLNDTNLNLGPSLPNKSVIDVWNSDGSGFTVCNKAGGIWTPNVTITPGEGFFVVAKTATNWVQTLPSN